MEKTLYKKDKNDTFRRWKIQVIDNTIHVEYGTDSGKVIKKSQIISDGKNIGKVNETSPNQQALLEAESKIRKKIDEGYTDENSSLITQIHPMLAHEYDKFSHKIKFPCYIQPKLDGYRMVYNRETRDMSSRNNKKYTILYNTEMHKELQSLDLFLDGELYVHDSNYSFENYGILRKKELKQEDTQQIGRIKYYVFDIISDKNFKERLITLQTLKKYKYIIPVTTILCYTPAEINKYHDIFVKEGYEGSMIRNKDSKYINSRSYDLLKYKNFDDHEFKVIGFDYESNFSDDNMKPVIWRCITPTGQEFNVQSKGTRSERNDLYTNGNKYIGKMLSVKFFGYTEDNIPRFPKTLRAGKLSFKSK